MALFGSLRGVRNLIPKPVLDVRFLARAGRPVSRLRGPRFAGALPWSFDTSKELDGQIRDLVGQLATGLDDSAKAAVVYFVPDDSRDRVMKELAYVQDKIPGPERENHEYENGSLSALRREH